MPDTQSPVISPDDVGRAVMLVYGTMSDRNPFWCFIAVKPSQQERFKGVLASKKLDLRTYEQDGLGEIIVSGEGVVPPNEVILEISTMFKVPVRELFKNVDVNAEIAKEIERLKKELGEK